MKPKYIYRDVLYGKVPFSENDLKIFQTKEMIRLRKVSVGTMPAWCAPAGNICTRFDHSFGVWHLAKKLTKKPEFEETRADLCFAALAHDLATPPFSHASDRSLERVFGKDHEKMVEEIIFDSEFGLEVENQGGNLHRIAGIIQNTVKPWGDLISGSIDLDNLDNTLRFGLTTGLFQRKIYSPEKLAMNFSIKNDQIVLLSDDGLKEWEQCRRLAYGYIYDEYPEAENYRLMDLAFAENLIDKKFFSLDDTEALEYLKKNGSKGLKRMIDRFERWEFYPIVYAYTTQKPNEKSIEIFENSREWREKLSDLLADHLKISPEDIYAGVFRNKGYKKIHLPILSGSDFKMHEPRQEEVFMIRISIHPSHFDKILEIKKFVDNLLGI